MGCDQIFVLGDNRGLADIGPEMCRDAEEFLETFNVPGEKVSPLMVSETEMPGPSKWIIFPTSA